MWGMRAFCCLISLVWLSNLVLAQSLSLETGQLWNRAVSHNLMADSTRVLLEMVIDQSRRESNDSILAEAHHLLGKHYFLIMQEHKAQSNFRASKQLFEKQQRWEKTGYALIQLGNCYLQSNLLDSAMMAYQEANQIYQDHDMPDNIWTTYIGLANVHHKANQLQNAFSFARKAVEESRRVPDRASKVIALNLILRLARENDSTALLVRYSDELFRHFSPMELDQEKMAHINYFVHIQDPSHRIHALKTAIDGLEGYQPSLELISSYNQLAQAYHESGNIPAAIQAWEYALSIERDSLKLIQFTPYMLRSLSDQYQLEGDHEKALAYFQRYSQIKDSLTQVYNQSRIDELQLQYETREKDAALANQQLVLSRRTAQRNWIIVITAVVLMVGIYALYVQRRHLQDQKTISSQREKIHQVEIEELNRQHEIQHLQTLVTAQEEERKRIALDLHDSLGGLLATLKIQARKLKDQGVVDPFIHVANEHVQLIDSLSAETRRIAHNMMPPALIRMGLSAAIEDLVQAIHQDKTLEVTFQNIDYNRSLKQDQEITLYRIVQELCSNVIRHAEAHHLLIQLSRHNGSATLVVEDDGKGFDAQSNSVGGLGFESIRSRVAYLDGDMEILTHPGEGTSITINVPVS